MSKYTTELRYIIENYNDNETSDNASSDEFITKALPKLFNFSFPIYDESYRQTLELNIVKHYYTREICTETVGRWKMFLRDRLNIIMPKYNIMYKELEELQDKLLANVDITESRELQAKGDTSSKSNNSSNSNNKSNETQTASNTGNSDSTSTSKGKGTSDSWQTANDTPQGALTDLENNRYLSSATHNKGATTQDTNSTSKATSTQEGTSSTLSSNENNSSSNSNSSSESNSTESYVKKELGKRGGDIYLTIYNQLVQSYLNIDEMIINELADLFFQLW